MNRLLMALVFLVASGASAFAREDYREPDAALTAPADAPMRPRVLVRMPASKGIAAKGSSARYGLTEKGGSA